MSETVKVYCTVLVLISLFIIGIHLLAKFLEYLIDKLFDDHKFFDALERVDIDDSYSTDTVECLTEEYIRDWMYDPSSSVMCGDLVFVYLIQDKEYLELLDAEKLRLFHKNRRKQNAFIVNMAVRNHISLEFERIHSVACYSISSELASLERQGMWFPYDMSLVG